MLVQLEIFMLALTFVESHKHFYRKDYTYFEEFDAFYKLHVGQGFQSYDTAFMMCDDEGAQLFYPKLENEQFVVKNLTASLEEPLPENNTTKILVGIHDEIGRGDFIAVDGNSTPSPIVGKVESQDCVVMDIETGVISTDHCDVADGRLFLCKKVEERPCPTIDRGYVYSNITKKCYKVNQRKKPWPDALHTCFVEGGLLVVIESQGEANVIRDILGQWFEEVYQRWYNDPKDEMLHDCGTVHSSRRTLYTSTKVCSDNLPFICEMTASAV